MYSSQIADLTLQYAAHSVYFLRVHVSQLFNLFIATPRIRNFILLLMIVCVCSFSKMLPSVKFAEDKMLVFVILCEKC